MRKTILVVGAIVLLSTSVATAQTQLATQCAADIKAACGDVAPGSGNLRSCLNSHLADLTRPCQTFLVGAAALAGECRGDIQAKCSDVQPGGGRIEACLQSHLTELSPSCVDVMARTVGRGQ